MEHSDFCKHFEYNQYATLVDLVKASLSLRVDNDFTPVKLGGNPTEFLFTLTHNIESITGKTGSGHSCSKINYNTIRLTIDPSLKNKINGVRLVLSEYIKKQNCKEVTFSELENVDFLSSYIDKSYDIPLLISALNKKNMIISNLDSKEKLYDDILAMFNKEKINLAKKYLNELDININDLKSNHPIFDMIKRHPVHKVNLDDLYNRRSQMIQNLLSNEDLLLVKELLSFPVYISSFCTRLISLVRIVKFSLNERVEEFKSVTDKFNKEIDEE